MISPKNKKIACKNLYNIYVIKINAYSRNTVTWWRYYVINLNGKLFPNAYSNYYLVSKLLYCSVKETFTVANYISQMLSDQNN